MARIDDQLIDLVQQLRGEQADVVLERLEVVVHILKRAVSEHLANGVVVVHQFMQTVIVAIQIEPDHATDKNRPQGHAGAPVGLAHLGRNLPIQQFKDRRAKCHVHVQMLQAPQNLRDVVA